MWVSVPNSMVIQPVIVKIIQSGHKQKQTQVKCQKADRQILFSFSNLMKQQATRVMES